MRNFILYTTLALSANALAIDSYNSTTGTLQMDGVVDNGTQYNNVTVQIPSYNLISQGSNGTSYLTPSNCQRFLLRPPHHSTT